MKKYTLEQLKTEKIAIHTKTQEIFDTLIKKLEERKICWANGQQANKLNLYAIHQERTSIDLFAHQGKIACAIIVLNRSLGYTIITPDQIDWGKEKKAEVAQVAINCGKEPTINWEITTTFPPTAQQNKQDKTPAVFIKAQKDWNGFKAFLKEVESHGRGLTSSQLKTFMANIRKDMGEDKK